MKNGTASRSRTAPINRQSRTRERLRKQGFRYRLAFVSVTGFCVLFMIHASAPGAESEHANDYAVVVSQETFADAQWNAVTKTLLDKHQGKLVIFRNHLSESRPRLVEFKPTHVCFVATPKEAGRDAIADMHALCRDLDEDPYYDCLWGVVTGFDAQDALEIAQLKKPLIVKRVGAGTEIALELCREGQWYCELEQGKHVVKEVDGEAVQKTGPADTTSALASLLTDFNADLFVTSGHATERGWQIGYRYRNGSFRSKAGKLYGRDTDGREFDIRSDHDRVYLPIGNCLMGHIDGPDAMALAWMHSAGVRQMIGYTVPTWYGYAGWGMLDYFVEQPGRYTFAESFYVNQQALIHRLTTYFPDVARQNTSPGQMRGVTVTCGETAKLAGLSNLDGRGLLFDRDVVAFYGDPAWQARMADGPKRWAQKIYQQGEQYIFEIEPLEGKKSFNTVNSNGAQRGGRPIVQRLPRRIRNARILAGNEFEPMIADDFILVPRPAEDFDQTIRIVFTADPEADN